MIKTTGFLTVLGLLVYGQVPDMPLSEWSHIPAVGLLGFLLYWLVVKQQPKERKETREHTERIAAQIGSDFKAVQKEQHQDSKALIEKVSALAENCASHLATGKGK